MSCVCSQETVFFPDSEDEPEVQPGELLLIRNILETSNKNALFKTHKPHNQTLEYLLILLIYNILSWQDKRANLPVTND